MTEQQFAYWLNGFAELNGATPPTAEQWKSIREHLATVFKKITPPVQTAQSALEDLVREVAKKTPIDAIGRPYQSPDYWLTQPISPLIATC